MRCNSDKSDRELLTGSSHCTCRHQSKENKNQKALRLRAGWQHYWYEPDVNCGIVPREIVRGPFATPQLVAAAPFVFVNSAKRNITKYGNTQIPYEILNGKRGANLRTGIPDPWAEYLAFNAVARASKRIHPHEIDLWSGHTQLTEAVWHKWGISLEQGIPDPWKNWPKTVDWQEINSSILRETSDEYKGHEKFSSTFNHYPLEVRDKNIMSFPKTCATNGRPKEVLNQTCECSCKEIKLNKCQCPLTGNSSRYRGKPCVNLQPNSCNCNCARSDAKKRVYQKPFSSHLCTHCKLSESEAGISCHGKGTTCDQSTTKPNSHPHVKKICSNYNHQTPRVKFTTCQCEQSISNRSNLDLQSENQTPCLSKQPKLKKPCRCHEKHTIHFQRQIPESNIKGCLCCCPKHYFCSYSDNNRRKYGFCRQHKQIINSCPEKDSNSRKCHYLKQKVSSKTSSPETFPKSSPCSCPRDVISCPEPKSEAHLVSCPSRKHKTISRSCFITEETQSPCSSPCPKPTVTLKTISSSCSKRKIFPSSCSKPEPKPATCPCTMKTIDLSSKSATKSKVRHPCSCPKHSSFPPCSVCNPESPSCVCSCICAQHTTKAITKNCSCPYGVHMQCIPESEETTCSYQCLMHSNDLSRSKTKLGNCLCLKLQDNNYSQVNVPSCSNQEASSPICRNCMTHRHVSCTHCFPMQKHSYISPKGHKTVVRPQSLVANLIYRQKPRVICRGNRRKFLRGRCMQPKRYINTHDIKYTSPNLYMYSQNPMSANSMRIAQNNIHNNFNPEYTFNPHPLKSCRCNPSCYSFPSCQRAKKCLHLKTLCGCLTCCQFSSPCGLHSPCVPMTSSYPLPSYPLHSHISCTSQVPCLPPPLCFSPSPSLSPPLHHPSLPFLPPPSSFQSRPLSSCISQFQSFLSCPLSSCISRPSSFPSHPLSSHISPAQFPLQPPNSPSPYYFPFPCSAPLPCSSPPPCPSLPPHSMLPSECLPQPSCHKSAPKLSKCLCSPIVATSCSPTSSHPSSKSPCTLLPVCTLHSPPDCQLPSTRSSPYSSLLIPSNRCGYHNHCPYLLCLTKSTCFQKTTRQPSKHNKTSSNICPKRSLLNCLCPNNYPTHFTKCPNTVCISSEFQCYTNYNNKNQKISKINSECHQNDHVCLKNMQGDKKINRIMPKIEGTADQTNSDLTHNNQNISKMQEPVPYKYHSNTEKKKLSKAPEKKVSYIVNTLQIKNHNSDSGGNLADVSEDESKIMVGGPVNSVTFMKLMYDKCLEMPIKTPKRVKQKQKKESPIISEAKTQYLSGDQSHSVSNIKHELPCTDSNIFESSVIAKHLKSDSRIKLNELGRTSLINTESKTEPTSVRFKTEFLDSNSLNSDHKFTLDTLEADMELDSNCCTKSEIELLKLNAFPEELLIRKKSPNSLQLSKYYLTPIQSLGVDNIISDYESVEIMNTLSSSAGNVFDNKGANMVKTKVSKEIESLFSEKTPTNNGLVALDIEDKHKEDIQIEIKDYIRKGIKTELQEKVTVNEEYGHKMNIELNKSCTELSASSPTDTKAKHKLDLQCLNSAEGNNNFCDHTPSDLINYENYILKKYLVSNGKQSFHKQEPSQSGDDKNKESLSTSSSCSRIHTLKSSKYFLNQVKVKCSSEEVAEEEAAVYIDDDALLFTTQHVGTVNEMDVVIIPKLTVTENEAEASTSIDVGSPSEPKSKYSSISSLLNNTSNSDVEKGLLKQVHTLSLCTTLLSKLENYLKASTKPSGLSGNDFDTFEQKNVKQIHSTVLPSESQWYTKTENQSDYKQTAAKECNHFISPFLSSGSKVLKQTSLDTPISSMTEDTRETSFMLPSHTPISEVQKQNDTVFPVSSPMTHLQEQKWHTTQISMKDLMPSVTVLKQTETCGPKGLRLQDNCETDSYLESNSLSDKVDLSDTVQDIYRAMTSSVNTTSESISKSRNDLSDSLQDSDTLSANKMETADIIGQIASPHTPCHTYSMNRTCNKTLFKVRGKEPKVDIKVDHFDSSVTEASSDSSTEANVSSTFNPSCDS